MNHRPLQLGETVKVYRNLHKKCFSVQDKTGHVVAHVQHLSLANVTFIIRGAGRRRVLETGRKNVHAFVKGTVVKPSILRNYRQLRYNPYQADCFHDVKDYEILPTPITKASRVQLSPIGVLAEL